MNIIANSIRENVDDLTVFFTLTDDKDTEYQWHCDAPKGADVQAYLDQNAEKFLLLIRRREYPGAVNGRDYIIKEGETELEALKKWINDGARSRNDDGEFTGVIERKPWKSTHPVKSETLDRGKITDELKSNCGIGTLEERVTVLENIIFGRVK